MARSKARVDDLTPGVDEGATSVAQRLGRRSLFVGGAAAAGAAAAIALPSPASAAGTALDDLDDVDVTGAVAGQGLVFDGADWTAEDIPDAAAIDDAAAAAVDELAEGLSSIEDLPVGTSPIPAGTRLVTIEDYGEVGAALRAAAMTDFALTGPVSSSSGHLATFSGTTGKVIADESSVTTSQTLDVTSGSVTVRDGTSSHGKVLFSSSGFYNSGVFLFSDTGNATPNSVLSPIGGLQFGGGSSATDWILQRTAAATATLTGDVALGTSTGTKIGTAANQKLGLYGATPVVQPSGAAQAAVVTTAATQTLPWGFTTQAQADAVVALVNALRTALVNTGLIKGSA